MSRTVIRTRCGILMDLIAPRKDDIDLTDIAYALARINRFTGHTETTIAQHSVSVMLALYHQPDFPDMLLDVGISAGQGLLIALLHDAHEAYVGDISRPMKEAIGRCAYQKVNAVHEVENPVTLVKRGMQRVIHQAFNLPEVVPKVLRNAIEVADRKVLDTEIVMEQEWHIKPWSAPEATERFHKIAFAFFVVDRDAVSFIDRYAGDYVGSYGAEVK